MTLTEEQIKQINYDCPDDQGIFREANGVPHHIKEPVIYLRWNTGGSSGGSCWGGRPSHYSGDPEPAWESLDRALEILSPGITYLQYKQIERLVHTNEETDYGYYGNCDEYTVKYIILSELIELLERM